MTVRGLIGVAASLALLMGLAASWSRTHYRDLAAVAGRGERLALDAAEEMDLLGRECRARASRGEAWKSIPWEQIAAECDERAAGWRAEARRCAERRQRYDLAVARPLVAFFRGAGPAAAPANEPATVP